MKLVRTKIAGYRSLVDVDFEVRPLTVLIGPNGSGKTSLLDTFTLLRSGAQGELSQALTQRGGTNATLPRIEPKPSKTQFEFDFQDSPDGARLVYAVQLGATAVAHEVLDETIKRRSPEGDEFARHISNSRDDQEGELAGWKIKGMKREELALAEGGSGDLRAIRTTLLRITSYAPLPIEARASVRLPQTLTPARIPSASGDSLFSALYNLREHQRESYERILDAVRLTFPGFQRLEFPIVGAGQVNLAWHQEDLAGPLYSNELSDGTLRFLWLTTILLTPEPPPIVLIDEPESSLHPQMLRVLAELMQDAALRTTVIVATHATELIRWLKPEQVLVLDKEDGRTRATWADEMDLDAWLREYTLSDLWLMGNLGGRS